MLKPTLMTASVCVYICEQSALDSYAETRCMKD